MSHSAVKLWDVDMATVKDGAFLNDNIVTFYVEYLSHVKHKDRPDDDAMEFLQPGTAFFAGFADHEDLVEGGLPDLHLHTKRWVLVPVNDNADQTVAGGGSHWSLLAFDRAARTFRHFDSAGASNLGQAQHLARKLTPFVVPSAAPAPVGGTGAVAAAGAGSAHPGPPLPVTSERCARQGNGYDCGVFMLLFMDALAEGEAWQDKVRAFTDADALRRRQEIVRLVEELRRRGT